MIRFMVLGAPRSGTAWSANWLSDGKRLCIHEPLWDHHYADLDKLYPGCGVACTGLAMFHEWVNAHPCRKVVLHRDPAEVQRALARAGLPNAPRQLFDSLSLIVSNATHVDWREVFRNPRRVWEDLLGEPFDGHQERRHAQLCHLNVTANLNTRAQNMDVLEKLRADIPK
jgi:hypothetical protein